MCLYGDGGVSRSVVFDSSVTLWTAAHQAPLSIGILQARILEGVAIPFSRDLPNPGIEPASLCITGRFFTVWATREALSQGKCPITLELQNIKAVTPWGVQAVEAGLQHWNQNIYLMETLEYSSISWVQSCFHTLTNHVTCTMSRTSFHSSSGTLSIRSSPLNLLLTSTV